MTIEQKESQFENLEAKTWNSYHNYLVISLGVVRFFALFMIAFTGLSINVIAEAIYVDATDMIVLLAIVNAGAGFGLFLRNISDKIGRKLTIIILNIGWMLSNCFLALSTNALYFLLVQLFSGFFTTSITGMMLAEEVPAKFRGRSIGIVEGIGALSLILASFLSIFLDINELYWRQVFWIMGIIGIIINTILVSFIKESRRFNYFLQNKKGRQRSYFSIFHKKYRKVLLLSVLLLFACNAIYGTIKRYFSPFLLYERIGFTHEIIGYWAVFMYISSIIGYNLSGFFSDKIGRRKSISISAVFYFIGSLFILFSYDYVLLFIGFLIINFFFAVFLTTASVLCLEFFSTEDRSLGSGWIGFFISILSIPSSLGIYFIANSKIGLGLGWGTSFLIFGSILIVIIGIVPFFFKETKGRIIEEIYRIDIEDDSNIAK